MTVRQHFKTFSKKISNFFYCFSLYLCLAGRHATCDDDLPMQFLVVKQIFAQQRSPMAFSCCHKNENSIIANEAPIEIKTMAAANKHVALLLAGCGVYDGSECTEAVSMMLHLERNGCTFDSFAPNKDVAHTVNHTDGSASDTPARNVMVESARICRGKIQDVTEFDVDKYDAVVIPGGFGAMKNLCSYAIEGAEKYELDAGVKKMIEDCLRTKTVLGLSCIAPMLLPKVQEGLKFTVGKSSGDDFPYAGTCADAKTLGADHVECDNQDIVVDEKNLIVTAPAFMQDAGYYAAHVNIGMMVDKVVSMS